MKKIFVFSISVLLLLGLLTACGAADIEKSKDTVPPTEATESAEEADVLKIMFLGSSRSVNTFQLMYQVFQDQLPEQKIVLGIMYHSGCSISMHVDFMKNNEAVYDYYLNTTGRWVITNDVNMDTGLSDQAWDVIVLQAGSGDTENNMNEAGRKYMVEYVDKVVEHPHVYWWHSTWTNSTDPALYENPAEAYSVDQVQQLTTTNNAAKQYVLDDPMFAGHIASGTPMMYAMKVLGVAEDQLYRDHTHLSDFGSLLVGYSWYAQFTGDSVNEINIDAIPSYLRHSQYQSQGDLTVTEEMKQIILKTVEYTLRDPWSVPAAP